ncbi:hypothetical protein N5E15_20570 [Pantoea stewartii]|uniref:Cap15 family cyclic dinucleotide receptor domain-containing protein n=1 Tax=Pantoea stewartii TaxID=66269 RepID=UPI0021D4AB8C|nr:hypothetical protein [Pantoea stewartii]MCU7368976.1 hypothetical protein [Pantoea stewartii]
MINLLPIGKIVSSIAVIYATVCCLILWAVYDEYTTFTTALSIASGGSFLLNAILAAIFFFGWRKIWQRFPKLNDLLFPDLNGTWDMIIHWEWEHKKGTSHASATIRQSFLSIGMDVEADDSDSQTLMAKPIKDTETGRPALYYVFLTTPKHKADFVAQAPYKGTAILKLNLDGQQVLNGNYFTSRKTVGYYELTRVD